MDISRRHFFKIVAGIGGAIALQGVDVLPEAVAEALPKEEDARYIRRTIKVELINNGYSLYFPDVAMMGALERENSWITVWVSGEPLTGPFKRILEIPCLFISKEGNWNIGPLPLVLKRREEQYYESRYLIAMLNTEA